jgi:hypothetical protein
MKAWGGQRSNFVFRSIEVDLFQASPLINDF